MVIPRVLFGDLLVLGVDTGTRAVEESLYVTSSCCFGHVKADHDIVIEDSAVVALNETHSSHISSQIVNFIDSLDW
jgi:hypothetical protein